MRYESVAAEDTKAAATTTAATSPTGTSGRKADKLLGVDKRLNS
jgi:hypothetical protein